MGQPAARLGDLTAHGGVVATGSPNVFVNGQPAAAAGDLHVCPPRTLRAFARDHREAWA